MKKARLIKRNETTVGEQAKPDRLPPQPMVKKTLDAVNEWIENRKTQHEDPRKAFAALFSQPQTQ